MHPHSTFSPWCLLHTFPLHTSFHKLTWILFIWAHSEFRMAEIWKGFRILESDKSCHFSWEVQIRCKVLGKDAVREQRGLWSLHHIHARIFYNLSHASKKINYKAWFENKRSLTKPFNNHVNQRNLDRNVKSWQKC